MNLPSQQRGMSVTMMMVVIMLVVVCAKLGLAIIPAQVGHYQLKKSLAFELKKANDNKETPKDFISNVAQQWNINGFDQKPEDVITITDNVPGALSINLKYEQANNFFGNVDILNRFDDTITAEDAKVATP
jgi:hypothetical protein